MAVVSAGCLYAFKCTKTNGNYSYTQTLVTAFTSTAALVIHLAVANCDTGPARLDQLENTLSQVACYKKRTGNLSYTQPESQAEHCV